MIYRGVPYPLCLYFTSGDTGSLVWGGGGGGGGGGGVVFCYVLFLAVLFPLFWFW